LVLTLRADFFEHASSYRPLADALQDSMVILGPMNRKELQDVIEKPAHLLGVRIEEGLSKRLLEAVGDEPGNLPLLEFALTQLWSRRRHRTLTHAAYEEIGGVKQALAVHAEEAFHKLDPQEEQRVRRIFTQLVQPSWATEDTRRIATESELGPENWELVARLADERLVVTGRDEVNKEETAEIVHEALIREWDRLRQWTNEDREFRQWHERLRAAMRQWQMSGRDNGALLRGRVLAEAKHWLRDRGGELAGLERHYIHTSNAMKLRTILYGGPPVILGVISAILVLAVTLIFISEDVIGAIEGRNAQNLEHFVEHYVRNFLTRANNAETAAFLNSDPTYAEEFFKDEAFSQIETDIANLIAQGLVSRSQFVGARVIDIRPINSNSVEVDTCETWAGNDPNRRHGSLILSEPLGLVPQAYTIEEFGGSWFITQIQFHPLHYC
jgi:conflict system STAND superfamily ATPase